MGAKSRKRCKQRAQKLLKAAGNICYLCNGTLMKNDITKDHVFPKSMGYHIGYNMMPAHSECNRDKGNRLPSTEELSLVCESYEAIGEYFDPKLSHEHGHKAYYKPFLDIGMRRFA